MRKTAFLLSLGFIFGQIFGQIFLFSTPPIRGVFFTPFSVFADEEDEDGCTDYCQSQGSDGGQCRQSESKCTHHGEVHKKPGDQFCPKPNKPVCCCQPLADEKEQIRQQKQAKYAAYKAENQAKITSQRQQQKQRRLYGNIKDKVKGVSVSKVKVQTSSGQKWGHLTDNTIVYRLRSGKVNRITIADAQSDEQIFAWGEPDANDDFVISRAFVKQELTKVFGNITAVTNTIVSIQQLRSNTIYQFTINSAKILQYTQESGVILATPADLTLNTRVIATGFADNETSFTLIRLLVLP